MLTIIKSGFCSLGREKIKEEIKKYVAEEKRVILIVPEQETVLAEAEMADFLPSFSPLCFEATNFTRLANSTARALGGISGEYCDKTKKSLIMWRTLTELLPMLSVGGVNRVNESLVSRYLSAVEQLCRQGITEDTLLNALASEKITDPRLKAKLSDLSLVFSLYKKLLSERYLDTSDDTSRVLEKLKENPDYLKESYIYIEGFTSFTAPQYSVIAELCARASVSVLLSISHASGESFEYTEVRDTIERLKQTARLANVQLKIKTEDSKLDYESPISLSADLLWRQNGSFDNISLQKGDEIRIFEAETPFSECEFIASDIKRRVMSGCSYSDFAIIARSADRYIGVLDSALNLASVPAFFSKKKDLSECEAVKLIYSAYSAMRSGFSRESVIVYAKCSSSGISRDECDELEYYAEKWQISGSRFTSGELWNMNPDGYSTAWREGAAERLIRINEIRSKLITPLSRFAEGAVRAKTVREQAELLISFLLDIDLPRSLEREKERFSSLGESAKAEEAGRIWSVICQSLDTLVEVSGDCPSSAEDFIGQLKITFGEAGISRIPAYVDEVTVGSADMLRLYGKKHIYLIGVNAGVFPASVSDNSYFSEKDKQILSSIDIPLMPETEIKGARELYIFTRSYTYAKESVTLTYSAKSGRYKATERSGVIDRLTSVVSGLEVKKISELSAFDKISSPLSALCMLPELSEGEAEAAVEALKNAGHSEELLRAKSKITNESLYIDKGAFGNEKDSISLTQSRIDSFLGCPFGYFCKYTLYLSPEEPAEFDAKNIGTFVHAILENVFRYVRDEGVDAGELSKEERRALCEDAAKKYLLLLGEGAEVTDALTKIKISRLVRATSPIVDGLCDEFASSGFKPRFFELQIAKNRENCPEPVVTTTAEGRNVYVYGYIDRVDTYEDGDDVYVRVVDYKTGTKKFSPEDIKEGKNLQMFLYLKSIIDTKNEAFRKSLGVKGKGRAIPAGVIYVKTALTDTRIDTPSDALAEEAVRDAQGREGMVLDDEKSLCAMGLEYTPLIDKRKPDKISDAKRKYLFTKDSFDQLMDDAMTVVSSVADGIAGGDIKALPRVDKGSAKCENCEFKPICRSAVIK